MTKTIPQSGTMLSGLAIIQSDKLDKSKPATGILFAHGIGEIGNNIQTVSNFLTNQTPNLVALINSGNFILIAPQLQPLPLGGGASPWSPNYFDFAYDYLVKNYSVNQKVFITGLSWGGQELWQWAGLHTDKLLGIVASCACYADTNFCNITVPVIAYHAKNDSQVPYSEGQVAINKILACNPKNPAQFIPYETGDHYIWNTVYGEPAVKSFFNGGSVVIPPSPTPTTLKADASATLTNVLGTTAVLDGSKSTGYNKWTIGWNVKSQPKNSDWNIFPGYNKMGAVVNLQNLSAGQYVFELTASDDKGNTSKDTVTLNVTAGKKIIQVITVNNKPANLFEDFTWAYQ